MKKLLISFAVVFYFSISFIYGQVSDSALIISKQSFILIPDTVVRVELTNAIKGFLKARYNWTVPNPFVDKDYLKKNDEPFQWLSSAEGKLPSGKDLYKPTLLAVLPIAEQKYIVKLAFMGVDIEQTKDPLLNLIATLEIRKINGKYFFYNAIE